jgi:hypothetical protein
MAHSPEVTLFVAAAGYGKSTALEAAKPRDDAVVRPARIVLVDGVPARGWAAVHTYLQCSDTCACELSSARGSAHQHQHR